MPVMDSVERKLLEAKCRYWWPRLKPLWMPRSKLGFYEAIVAFVEAQNFIGSDIPAQVVIAAIVSGSSHPAVSGNYADREQRLGRWRIAKIVFFQPHPFHDRGRPVSKEDFKRHWTRAIERDESYKWSHLDPERIISEDRWDASYDPQRLHIDPAENWNYHGLPGKNILNNLIGTNTSYLPVFKFFDDERQKRLDIHFQDVLISELDEIDTLCAICQNGFYTSVEQVHNNIEQVEQHAHTPQLDFEDIASDFLEVATKFKHGISQEDGIKYPCLKSAKDEAIDRLKLPGYFKILNPDFSLIPKNWKELCTINDEMIFKFRILFSTLSFQRQLIKDHKYISSILKEETKCNRPIKLPCGHIFGHECIRQWAMPIRQKVHESKRCPLCRTAICGPKAVFEKLT